MDTAAGSRLAAGLVVVAAPALLIGLIWVARQAAEPPGDDHGDVVRVGVVQDQSVDAYVASARAETAALPPGTTDWALVSLDSYVPPGQLLSLLGGTAAAEVYARVPLPGVHTQVLRIPAYRVPADVETGMLDAAVARDQERAEYQRLKSAVQGSGPAQQRARQAYEEAAGVAGAEAAAYRTQCACVFAAVVKGDTAGLTGLAARSGVRAVDPAPEVRSLDRADFRPPLPEQTGMVPPDPTSTPITVPTGRSTVASALPPPILSASSADVTSASSDVPARRPSDFPTEEPPAVPSPTGGTPQAPER